MEEVSNEDSGTDDEPLKETYYNNTVYKTRLSWTGYSIPVSYLDEDNFLLESYIDIVRNPGQYTTVQICLAHFPILHNSNLDVSQYRILPTGRVLHNLSERANYTSLVSELSFYISNKLHFLVKEFDIKLNGYLDEKIIKKFYTKYIDFSWTMHELANIFLMYGEDTKQITQQITEAISNKVLSISHKKQCLVCSEIEDSYKMGSMPTNISFPEILADIEKDYMNCVACSLGLKREKRGTKIVFGRGKAPSNLLILGEAPGVSEEELGIPFNKEAPAGKILCKVMEELGINQDECYITNSVICRPEAEEGKAGLNGTPKSDHIKACNSRLKRVLMVVKPKVVVILGTTAYEAFFGHKPKDGITKAVGWAQEASTFKTYITFHPSYIHRQLIMAKSVEDKNVIKEAYRSNWKQIKEELDKYHE